MLIINADDWGGWKTATDAALACYKAGRITSVSAMVFMEDSERAARLAGEVGIDVGLHVNFTFAFSASNCPRELRQDQDRIRRFLKFNKYSQLVYNPFLRREFRSVFRAQVDEFQRLYGRAPSHIDGHQHMHLCANMLIDWIIPAGEKVRRSFSFLPGEKSAINRAYRHWVDHRLAARHRLTDYFFSLSQQAQLGQIARVVELARGAAVELMTHPEWAHEYSFLMGSDGEALTAASTGRSGAASLSACKLDPVINQLTSTATVK